ncbi:outer membrane beta-barrel protein [Novosphingobium sp. BL-8A]|uniref:outer membrane beta-barrel protein n=1 Tax=Novosphingobium sp. BL-8A TaxID=3127639 RepID=UPI0037569E31
MRFHRHTALVQGGLSALALAAVLAAPPVLAQQQRFVIAPRPLDRALMELARQSGRNILFAPESIAGMISGSVDAQDFDTALRQMTRGLSVRIGRQGKGVSIMRPARPSLPIRRKAARPAVAAPIPASEGEAIFVQGLRSGPVDLVGAGEPAPAADTLPGDQPPATDRNLAEAVARMPGVLTLTTNLQGDLGGNDRAARAEGQFAAIRGLGGAYSLATIDGVAMPQSLPYGREVQLGMLPSFGFAALELVKVPGPERAGDVTGAVIDIRAPSAFDGSPQGLKLVAAGGIDTNARRYGQDAGNGQLGLRYVRRFGAGDRLGIAITAQAGRRAFANSQQTYQQGTVEFRVVDAEGRSPAGIDPARNLLPTSVNAQFTRGTTHSTSAMAAFDYQASSSLRLFARLTFAGSRTEQDIYQLGFQSGSSAGDITRTPIGNGLYAQASTNGAIRYWYQTNPERSSMLLGQTGLNAALGRTDLRLRLYAGSGVTRRPDHVEVSFWDPTATRLENGVSIGMQGGYPVPLLTAADARLAQDLSNFPVRLQGEVRSQRSSDHRFGGELAASRRSETGSLRLIDAGLAMTRSRRAGQVTDVTYDDVFPSGTTLGSSGLVTQSIGAILPGIYDFALPLVDRQRLLARIRAAAAPVLSPDELYGQSFTVSETVAAVYARARIAAGPIILAPGLRAERAWIDARYWVSGNDGVDAGGIDYGWNRGRAHFDALLPSIGVRWNPGARQAMRATLWTSYVRPSSSQLAGSATVENSDTGAVEVIRGNPDLRAVRALNFDWSFEWRAPDEARFSVALFAKRLKHYLYDAGGDYANAADRDETGVVVIEPTNGGTARLAGIEFSANLPLARLDGALEGWRVSAQTTLLHARVRLKNPRLDPVEHMQYAPERNLSVELGYSGRGWSGAVTGRWTGRYLQQYGLFGRSASGNSVLDGSALDVWVRPSSQIDFNIAREMAAFGTVRFFVRNLLADHAYRSTVGRHSSAVSQTIATGRVIGVRIDRSF